MCNLSDGIEQMAREDERNKVTKEVTTKVTKENKKAFAESLINLLNLGKITLADAANALNISEEEFKAYMA